MRDKGLIKQFKKEVSESAEKYGIECTIVCNVEDGSVISTSSNANTLERTNYHSTHLQEHILRLMSKCRWEKA